VPFSGYYRTHWTGFCLVLVRLSSMILDSPIPQFSLIDCISKASWSEAWFEVRNRWKYSRRPFWLQALLQS
jgi:hypothetical protein